MTRRILRLYFALCIIYAAAIVLTVGCVAGAARGPR